MRNNAGKGRDWSSHPPLIYSDYKSTALRGPTQALVAASASRADRWAPQFRSDDIAAINADLTRNARRDGEPIGERIVVSGRIVDEKGRPQKNILIEIWQANAAGRYVHKIDQHDAPLDPNFLGAGHVLSDAQGRYRFYTIKPGAYPWANHQNAWRPNHIHFSLLGAAFSSRLVTQMYFPGDPLLDHDPIFHAVPEAARKRLLAGFKMDLTQEGFALGYEFNIVLRGAHSTPMET